MASVLSSEDLTCSVCMSFFTEPVMLPCGHSFCRSCVEALDGQQRCPECRSSVSVQAASLPTNVALKKLTERVKEQRRDDTEMPELCPELQEKLKLFCITDQKLVCIICRDGDQHQGHQFKPIKEAAAALRKELETFLQHAADDINAIERLYDAQQEEIRQTKETSEQLMTQISREFEEMQQFLRKREDEIKTELKLKEAGNVEKMTEVLNAIEAALSETRELESKAASVLKTTDPEQFLKTWTQETSSTDTQHLFRPRAKELQLVSTSLSMGPYESHLQFFVWKEMLQMIRTRPEQLRLKSNGPNIAVSNDGRRLFWKTKTAESQSFFGSSQTQSSRFGSLSTPSQTQSSGFGSLSTPSQTQSFGFGSLSTPSQTQSSLFGSLSTPSQTQSSGFGSLSTPSQTQSSLFGSLSTPSQTQSSGFGSLSTPSQTQSSLFGSLSTPSQTQSSLFGSLSTPSQTQSSLFGSLSTPSQTQSSLFGSLSTPSQTQSSGFGSLSTPSQTQSSLFGSLSTPSQTQSSGFGLLSTPSQTQSSLFGSLSTPSQTQSSGFGSLSTPSQTQSSLFGSLSTPSQTQSSLFGSLSTPSQTQSSLFGSLSTPSQTQSFGFGSLSTPSQTQSSGLNFGSTGNAPVELNDAYSVRKFTSGQHYWEIEVGSRSYWELGIKGHFLRYDRQKYSSCSTKSITKLKLENKPRKIGIYLNSSGKKLSFYDADIMAHIHTTSEHLDSTSAYFSIKYSEPDLSPLTVCWY